MIRRPQYLEQIAPFVGAPMIKVLTGIRRCGKSCLLQQVRELLAEQDPEPSVHWIDMELSKNSGFRQAGVFETYLDGLRASPQGPRAILIDEVQEIPEWERSVNSLLKEGGWDIYLTGSNSRLLSGELATLLAGRYVEIHVLPLGYQEHLQFCGRPDSPEEFQSFLRFGGLPGLRELPEMERPRLQYLQAVQDSVLLRDVIERNAIRDPKTLESVLDFVYDNVGAFTSAKSMSEFLKSQRVNISIVTLQNYLRALESGYAIYQAKRYDIKGRKHLELISKYFLADLGLRFARIGSRDRDISGLLENTVFLELLRRGFSVSIGRIGEFEVDFVAEKDGKRLYVQVATTLLDPKTRDREFRSLEAIDDNFPKFVLSLDAHESHQDGILQVPLRRFLLDPHWSKG
ncbi:MAG: ATP-binding protein [Fibrobacteres bacterium]|nr:ATP-binding protein [Fibrobacterota bacterium]